MASHSHDLALRNRVIIAQLSTEPAFCCSSQCLVQPNINYSEQVLNFLVSVKLKVVFFTLKGSGIYMLYTKVTEAMVKLAPGTLF